MQALQTQTEANRFHSEAKITELVTVMTRLTEKIDAEKGQTAALRRIAAGQEKLLAVLEATEGGTADPESRMRLRSIDVQLLRILGDLNQLALAMRDMLDPDETYPINAWPQRRAGLRWRPGPAAVTRA